MQALDVKPVEVNVAETVGRALEREISPSMDVAVAVDPKLRVLAEPEYLFRAISNILRNAVRYAGYAGPIRVAVGSDTDGAWITVSDSGPGVPEDSLEEIFAPFYRLDPARTEETGGVGLGLSIVRTCVEACGGTVRCRNLKPSGLEVGIRLQPANSLSGT